MKTWKKPGAFQPIFLTNYQAPPEPDCNCQCHYYQVKSVSGKVHGGCTSVSCVVIILKINTFINTMKKINL